MKAGFFIIGAQKAGTTSLAALLDAVPGLFLSRPKEPMFFCFDDYEVHRNTLLHPGSKQREWAWDGDRAALLDRYENCFAAAADGDLCGEASTSYALSERAADRISDYNPEARIIMVLRDPIRRAWSSYWHCLRKGLVTTRFEEVIRTGGVNLIEYGHYAEQLRRYGERFSRGQIKVVHFEKLVSDEGAVLEDLLTFLGIQYNEDAVPAVPALNKSFYPRFPRLHRTLVRVMRNLGSGGPDPVLNLPDGSAGEEEQPGSSSGLRGLYRRLAMRDRVPEKMKPETRKVLIGYYRRENAGLNELLGENVFDLWGW